MKNFLSKQNPDYSAPIFSLQESEGQGWSLYMPLHPIWSIPEGKGELWRIKKAKDTQFFSDREEALKQAYALDEKFRNGEEVEY